MEVERYPRAFERCYKFKELALLLVHLTNILRWGDEVTGLRFVNGINRGRNVCVIDGEMVLVAQY